MNKSDPKHRRRVSEAHRLDQRKKAAEAKEKELRKQQESRNEAKARRAKVKKMAKQQRKTAVKVPLKFPEDLKIGEVVMTSRGVGVVRYIGPIELKKKKKKDKGKKTKAPAVGLLCGASSSVSDKGDEMWPGEAAKFIGVDLVGVKGKSDGKIGGKRYFKTKNGEKSAVFVKGLKKRIGPEELLEKLGANNSNRKQLIQEMEQIEMQLSGLKAQNEALKARNVELAETGMSVGTLPTPTIAIDMSTPNSADPPGTLAVSIESNDLGGISPRSPGVKAETEKSTLAAPPAPERNLVRATSAKDWKDDDMMGLMNDFKAELDNMHKEKALAALDLPEANAADKEILGWMTTRMTQYKKMDKSFDMPDLENKKVTSALLNVTRMLSNLLNPQSMDEMVRGGPMAARMSMGMEALRAAEAVNDDDDYESTDSDSSHSDEFEYDDRSSIGSMGKLGDIDSPRGSMK